MVLVDLLSAIGGLVRVKESADIDNAIFKLHYKITTSILFGFCILVTARSIVGDPINCVHGDDERLDDDVVDTYCWIHTTFTLPKYFGTNFPGIGPGNNKDDEIYHAYYQWVPFVLFIQGILFYSPHWLWKAWEGRRMDSMVMGLSSPAVSHDERKEKVDILADYLTRSVHHHNCYAIKFFICEFLNFFNAVFNMWFLNRFLGGSYLNLGLDLMGFMNEDETERTDPLIILFPRVTKCTFHMYGFSGTKEKRDFLCVLGLNVINEKIYVFLWYWFIFLAFSSALGMIYRAIIYCLPVVRIGLLHKKAKIHYKNSVEVLTKNLRAGDCFVLHLLSKNLELLSFNMLMEEIYIKFNAKSSDNHDENSIGCEERFNLMPIRT